MVVWLELIKVVKFVRGTVSKYGMVRIYFGQKVRYASTVRNSRSSTGTVRWYAIEMCLCVYQTHLT